MVAASVSLGFPVISLALVLLGAGLTGVIRPRFAFAVDHAEFGEVFHFLANPAAFCTIWQAGNSRQIPYGIWLFEFREIVTENGIRTLVDSTEMSKGSAAAR
jgi:hypothetical protein